MQQRRTISRLMLGALGIAVAVVHPAVAQGTTTGTSAAGTAATAGAGYTVEVVRRTGLGAPRNLVQLADGSLLIVDFGGWTKNKGRVLRVPSAGTGKPVTLFSGLDRPNAIVLGPDQQVYVGEVGRVFRFDPKATKPTKDYVIGKSRSTGVTAALPIRNPHLHPLVQMLFLKDGSLLVNLGSDTNNCAGDSKSGSCAAATGSKAVGVVRRYVFDKTGGRIVSMTVMATGLRNSMGFAQHKSGTMLQVENSRDAINEADPKLDDETLPHDELNELVTGRNYGWPYCYDNQVNSPEFKKYACKQTTAPLALLPAHSAPLGMTYWDDRLVLTYHGYRDSGHRVVSFAIDSKGKPVGSSTVVLGGWAETDDFAPGGPVGVIVSNDNDLLVVDDRNGTLLKVAKTFE
jgi:glucose/arabinose dehydrogenase